MTTRTIAHTSTGALPFAFAVVLGVALLAVSGMAQATVLHDAAHDQRHAMAFPCH
ncbi:MAG: CbtB-domain containing protein [Thalassovita sp.]